MNRPSTRCAPIVSRYSGPTSTTSTRGVVFPELSVDDMLIAMFADRRRVRQRGAHYARLASNSRQTHRRRTRSQPPRCIALAGSDRSRDQQMIRAKSEVERRHAPERARDDAGARDQHQRRRELRRRRAPGESIAASTCLLRAGCHSTSASTRLPRPATRAGTRPNRRPVSTAASKREQQHRAVDVNALDVAHRLRTQANEVANGDRRQREPESAPTSDRKRLSDSTWRASRHRLAPSARRTTNSRSRRAARASERFARLAHAMSSSTPTAANNSSSGFFVSPYRRSCNVITTGSSALASSARRPTRLVILERCLDRRQFGARGLDRHAVGRGAPSP